MTSNDPDDTATLGRRTLFAAGTAGLALSAAAAGRRRRLRLGAVLHRPRSTRAWCATGACPSRTGAAMRSRPPRRRRRRCRPSSAWASRSSDSAACRWRRLLPAFAESRYARPVALESGTPEKARLVAAQYGIRPEAIHGYADMPRLRENPEVRAVYVVTPNSLHREHVEAAAAAGKHVLCEKPMATNSADARAMIAACEAARVKLMVAYRVQYEPHNREVIRLSARANSARRG